jgi:uncharacterized protein (DUF305 family)
MTLEKNLDSETPARPGAGRRAGILIAILGVMLLFALVIILLTRSNTPGTSVSSDSPVVGFARDMIVHHNQAVEMALILYDHTENETLHTIALDILLSQQNQIGQMQGWLYLWQLPVGSINAPMAWMGMVVEGLMPGMATDEQMAELRASTGADTDRLFIELMIPHHTSAIHMANAISERTSIPAVLDFARSVIDSQTREIREMQKIYSELGFGEIEATIEPQP